MRVTFRHVLVVLAFALGLGSSAARANLVVDGNFDNPSGGGGLYHLLRGVEFWPLGCEFGQR
jgi:hypothetical protein